MMSESSEFTLEKKRLDRIKYYVLQAERDNLRARTDTFDQMVEKLRKIIEEEVRKCY